MESSVDEANELVESYTDVKDDNREGFMVVDVEPDAGEENRIEERSSLKKDLVVSEGDEPYVGMEFESQWDSKSFYNAYARRVGFGTRISYSHHSKRDRKMMAQQYVCVKEGFRLYKEGTNKHSRESTRIGCRASMTVKRIVPGKWVVKSFEKEHNHALVSPNEAELLRSHVGASDAARNLTTGIHRSIISRSDDITMSSVQCSRTCNISVNELGCKNGVDTTQKRYLAEGDAQVVVDYFKHMQNDNTSFYYAIQVDKEDHLTNVFWVDARSRMGYNYFGDAVTFDTTYIMNRYRMPLATFVGMNHHGQSILFGCALLVDGTKSSFVWLFKTWLAAMSGQHPISISTEYNKAIQAAVAEVFTETRHRFCMRHIQRKLSDKLGQVCHTRSNFEGEFRKCIYQSETIDEFESNWEPLLDTFDLRKHDWLQLLYEDRKHWVPMYLKGTFFAEMPTTQQSESINSFFDGYVNLNTHLEEFFRQYNNALDDWYGKEVRADFETMHTPPDLMTSSPMEKQAAQLYTREMFKRFQVELFECFAYVANKISGDAAIDTYVVAKFGEEMKAHTVTYSVSEMRGSCSCQMFEFTGILCRHVLNVFKVTNVSRLPLHYIMKRWTRNAKSRAVLDKGSVEVQGNCRQSMISRYNDLCHQSIKLADEGARSIVSYDLAVRALQGTLEELVGVNSNVAKQPPTPVSRSNHPTKISEGSHMNNMTSTQNKHNPHNLKGYASSSKLKPGRERGTRRKNTCNTCMQTGHNSRTCPLLTGTGSD